MRANRLFWIPVMAAGLVIGGCTAEKTDEGSLPDVDVQAKGGDLPNYDVDAADVTVTQDTQTVVTPDIDVKAPDGN
jgi:hypothetical protein